MSGPKRISPSRGNEIGELGKDSDLFRPLVRTAERYLREYCDGKQHDDEKAKFSLRVLSVYRRILKVEKEKQEIKGEWKRLIEGAAELRKIMRPDRASKAGKKTSAK